MRKPERKWQEKRSVASRTSGWAHVPFVPREWTTVGGIAGGRRPGGRTVGTVYADQSSDRQRWKKVSIRTGQAQVPVVGTKIAWKWTEAAAAATGLVVFAVVGGGGVVVEIGSCRALEGAVDAREEG